MLLGADVSNYGAPPTLDSVRALVTSCDMERLIVATQFEATYTAWGELALQLGVSLEAYLYLYNGEPRDYAQQVRTVLDWTKQFPVGRLWLDFEDAGGLQHSVDDALAAAAPLPVGIYTSEGYWTAAGNWQYGVKVPLWLAHWDNNPLDLSCNFGGWLQARCKQYAGEQHGFGFAYDLDVWRH